MPDMRCALLCHPKHSPMHSNHIIQPARDLQLVSRKLTSGRIVRHHPLLRVLGQHKHKSLVHGALVCGFLSTGKDFYSFFGGNNLINDPAASLNDHLGGEHPLDCVTELHTRVVHSSGPASLVIFSKGLFMGLSISAGGKGNLYKQNLSNIDNSWFQQLMRAFKRQMVLIKSYSL